jgi:hypothetical protein
VKTGAPAGLAAIALCALGACGPHAPTAPPPAAPGAAASIQFARCVPHAGETHRESQRVKPASGGAEQEVASTACSFNAECVDRQGVVTPGDGDVEIACADGACTCTLAPHAPGAAASTFTFAVTSPCDQEGGARQLLLTRCMTGTNGAADRSATGGTAH